MYIGYISNSDKCTLATLVKHCKRFLIFSITESQYAIKLEIFHENFQHKTLRDKPLRIQCGSKRRRILFFLIREDLFIFSPLPKPTVRDIYLRPYNQIRAAGRRSHQTSRSSQGKKVCNLSSLFVSLAGD
jgi:hypothetical protein